VNQHSALTTVHVCAYHCAQLSCTTQHRAVLILFPLILWIVIIGQILSIGGEKLIWFGVVNCMN